MAKDIRDIRLIGLDLDGTALNEKKQVTPRVKAAIEAATAAGIVVLPATGRMIGGIPENIMGLSGVRYAVASNGAMVYDVKTNEVLHCDCFELERALELAEICTGFDSITSVFVNGLAFSNQFDPEAYTHAIPPEVLKYLVVSRQQFANLVKEVRALGLPVEKFNLHFKTEAERQRAKAIFLDLGDVALTSSIPGNLELNTATANKGTALLALGRHLGIEKGQVMAVGDSSNDYEMLRAVGYAVAMGNARDDIKAIAHSITASAEEDGVALAIEQVLEWRRALGQGQ